MQAAGRGKGGIAKLLGGGYGQDDVVGRKLLGNVDKVDGDASCAACQ